MKLASPLRAQIIVDGTDLHHDLLGAAAALRDVVAEGGVVADAALGLDRFIQQPPATAEADVYVLYRSSVVFDVAQQKALADDVAAGKGLVILHSSNLFGFTEAGMAGDGIAHDLFGSRYLSHGDHGSEGYYQVIVAEDHAVTAHMTDFHLEDEFYVIEVNADVRVLAHRVTPEGEHQPVVYVRNHGEGRVVYVALGHDMRAWGNPHFRQLLRQAVLWAGGVTLDSVQTWSTRFPLGNGRFIGPDAATAEERTS
ncbi:ThuA domain-containing protein [Arthrobacter sp. GMC3]|uniref:ThuA domain-containing protein n=1 Tax=Arthrobacter sp. GMC3 TaxID=2058894 RepID=UPI000CE3E1F4|nr:ThuA domain-containing protein [Arthrobacter sp. GMC3]